jgi:hypothetical protein
MSRKALAMLPLYMAAMLVVAIVGLAGCIIGFIPMMIRPQLVVPIRDQIMDRFSQMMAQMAARQMAKGFHQ